VGQEADDAARKESGILGKLADQRMEMQYVKNRILALFGAVTLLVTVAAIPAQAAPPEQTEEPIFLLFLDFENDKAAFWNITRDDFCAWEASGFAGPPPVQELVPASTHETGQGALVASFRATRPLELWNLDDPANPEAPCSDTDGQPGPWATGHVNASNTDNDLFASGTRTNSFGDVGQGTVYDNDGDRWHYSWNFRAHNDRDGEFSISAENFNLKKKGN
jgi:hypothetical protein